MAIPDEAAILGTGHNYSLFLKRLFLTFVQALFSQHGKYTWKPNVSETSIIVCDKYALNFKLVEHKPAIVLERGGFNWMYTSIAQRHSKTFMSGDEVYTDLLRGSVRFNCLAKSGLVAEELAVIILQSLTGYKDQLRKNGIHQILNISIGEETLLKSDSEEELAVVPVVVVYTAQKMLTHTTDFYSIYVTSTEGDTVTILVEVTDYVVRQNKLTFTTAPASAANLSVIYLDANTLTEQTEVPTPATDGVTKEFYLSNSVYGYGPILEEVHVSALISGMDIGTYYHDSVETVSGWFNV